MAAVRVPPSACSTSQSTAMVFSPNARRSTQARSDRPISREISWVRPPTRPLTDSRSLRSWVEDGSIAYSAVSQPSPDRLRQRGTPGVTDAAQSTLVPPNSTRTDPAGCCWNPRVKVTRRSSLSARPSARFMPKRLSGRAGSADRWRDRSACGSTDRPTRLGRSERHADPVPAPGWSPPMNPIHKITGVLLSTAALSVLGAGIALARTPAGPPVPYSVSVTGPSGAHLYDDLSDLGNRLIEITPGAARGQLEEHVDSEDLSGWTEIDNTTAVTLTVSVTRNGTVIDAARLAGG